MKQVLIPLLLILASALASAKLPALGDEAKAKAAEATAKAAWSAKVDGFQLCQWQDKVAASYYKSATTTGKPTKPAVATAACAEPGVFAYTPPEAPKSLESSGAHSPAATATSPPGSKQPDAVVNPARKP